jgi:hypothetical protein
MYGEVGVYLHAYVTFELMQVYSQLRDPAALLPWERTLVSDCIDSR